MPEDVLYDKSFPVKGGDFDKAGEVSTQIKAILKETGIERDIIRRASIASFEAEMNVVIHAESGEAELVITATDIIITMSDHGPGIADLELAMQEGYSTASDAMRERGFGAGMGLPNIKKSVDDLQIESQVGVGTRLRMTIHHQKR
jgi:anti-sigma regulatory factor (Ser/Thr protein kinase)